MTIDPKVLFKSEIEPQALQISKNPKVGFGGECGLVKTKWKNSPKKKRQTEKWQNGYAFFYHNINYTTYKGSKIKCNDLTKNK